VDEQIETSENVIAAINLFCSFPAKNMLRAVLILVLFSVETLSNPTGPPAEACATMEPIGHINAGAVGSDLGFSISTSSDDVTGGSTLQSEKILKSISLFSD